MKDKQIIVQNLGLELTRKCNLDCVHCLRGDKPQNVEMSDKTIERVFEDIDGAYNLQFTGGETSLAVDRLKKVILEIKKHNTKIRSVLVFTNAVNISDEYIECLKELSEYCKTNNKKDADANKFDDDLDYNYKGLAARLDNKTYPVLVVVSLDKFHLESIDKLSSREQVKQNIEKLIKIFPVEIDKICNYMIYKEGKGVNLNNIYKDNPPPTEYAGLYWQMKEGHRDLCMIGPILNISYDGRIEDCNRTYAYADAHAIGNINEESFYKMLKKLQQDRHFKLYGELDKLYKRFDHISHKLITTTKSIKKMVKFCNRNNIDIDPIYFTNAIPDYNELNESENKGSKSSIKK